MRVLVLKTVDKDFRSHGGFQWPREVGATVTAPDWEPTKECGHGIHGFLRGRGDGSLAIWDAEAVWLALWVEESSIVDLGGKVKFPSCEIAFIGNRFSTTEFLKSHGCDTGVIGGTAIAGDRGTATVGYYGTATAGEYGTATAGEYGTATAGEYGTATVGYYGTATAGDRGTATAGDRGTAIAGYYGTANAGKYATATVGEYGTAIAGEYGILNIRYWDGTRYRLAVFYVGEDGIEPNVAYRVDNNGKPVKVEKSQ